MAVLNPLGPTQVAKLLGVTAMTIRRLSDRGELKLHVTPGGHRRYDKKDVIAYCQQKGLDITDSHSERPKILIVDDEHSVAHMIQDFLTTSGIKMTIELAFGGFEAGIKVQSFWPDIIITDLLMPDLNGIQMCKMLKSDSATQHIRIIGITGGSNDDVHTFIDAGAEACLLKPVKKATLLKTLNLKRSLEQVCN